MARKMVGMGVVQFFVMLCCVVSGQSTNNRDPMSRFHAAHMSRLKNEGLNLPNVVKRSLEGDVMSATSNLALRMEMAPRTMDIEEQGLFETACENFLATFLAIPTDYFVDFHVIIIDQTLEDYVKRAASLRRSLRRLDDNFSLLLQVEITLKYIRDTDNEEQNVHFADSLQSLINSQGDQLLAMLTESNFPYFASILKMRTAESTQTAKYESFNTEKSSEAPQRLPVSVIIASVMVVVGLLMTFGLSVLLIRKWEVRFRESIQRKSCDLSHVLVHDSIKSLSQLSGAEHHVSDKNEAQLTSSQWSLDTRSSANDVHSGRPPSPEKPSIPLPGCLRRSSFSTHSITAQSDFPRDRTDSSHCRERRRSFGSKGRSLHPTHHVDAKDQTSDAEFVGSSVAQENVDIPSQAEHYWIIMSGKTHDDDDSVSTISSSSEGSDGDAFGQSVDALSLDGYVDLCRTSERFLIIREVSSEPNMRQFHFTVDDFLLEMESLSRASESQNMVPDSEMSI